MSSHSGIKLRLQFQMPSLTEKGVNHFDPRSHHIFFYCK